VLPDGLAVELLVIAAPLALLSVTGATLGAIVGPGRPWLLLLAFGIGTQLAVVLPGRFFAHYYQLWLPPLAIGAGWTLAAFAGTKWIRRWVPSAVGAAAIALMVVRQGRSTRYRRRRGRS
jgi:hypothetical protein